MTSDISNEDNLIDIALLPIDMVDIQTLYDSEQDMLKYSSEYKVHFSFYNYGVIRVQY